MSSRSVVVSDTDILGHIINGGIFEVLVPHVIEEIYITPQVEHELRANGFYYSVFHQQERGHRIKLTKDSWASLSVESRQEVNKIRTRMRAVLDPGELDCYAYSVGLGIDAIISDDADARIKITDDSDRKKLVMNFAQLLLLGVKMDKFDLETAEAYFKQVIERNKLLRFTPFPKQIEFFDQHTVAHPWTKKMLSVAANVLEDPLE
jgi:predicted nucleic acid-binding protein